VEFPYGVNPAINREGLLECYIRLTQDIAEQGALAFCERVAPRKLAVWINHQLLANTHFSLEILGVTQPRPSDILPSS
jgi:hypothetical protein